MYFKRLDKMTKDVERKTDKLTQNIHKLSDSPTVLRMNEIEKDVKDIRTTLSDIISYIHSLRIW